PFPSVATLLPPHNCEAITMSEANGYLNAKHFPVGWLTFLALSDLSRFELQLGMTKRIPRYRSE
ncbi:MAG: hypothetical protein U9Q27_00230, partial [Patescibacteria group bacterium]|nr:hypothetical protein [Patescibacteria group bacterium]